MMWTPPSLNCAPKLSCKPVSLHDASSGGIPSRSAAVPKHSLRRERDVEEPLFRAGGRNQLKPDGMPTRSRPTGIVIAQSPR